VDRGEEGRERAVSETFFNAASIPTWNAIQRFPAAPGFFFFLSPVFAPAPGSAARKNSALGAGLPTCARRRSPDLADASTSGLLFALE